VIIDRCGRVPGVAAVTAREWRQRCHLPVLPPKTLADASRGNSSEEGPTRKILSETGSPFLLLAGDIDQQGHIVGEAFDANTGESPAFIATPVPPRATVSSAVRATTQENLPDKVRLQIKRRLGFGRDQ
jgi:hypothetical protein